LNIFSNDPFPDATVSPINGQEESLLATLLLPISTQHDLHDQKIEPHVMIILATTKLTKVTCTS
jgi:hypothetical protein